MVFLIMGNPQLLRFRNRKAKKSFNSHWINIKRQPVHSSVYFGLLPSRPDSPSWIACFSTLSRCRFPLKIPITEINSQKRILFIHLANGLSIRYLLEK